ncbi:MAG: nucleotidyl transferase AbiEii/AbiGii toxin family protein [Candidatus Aminicenantes bacterium]|nr:nucleotidyl transferase AbiEii/AbiGii toxin family protein [Candidatus Aminicenantes bacterium]
MKEMDLQWLRKQFMIALAGSSELFEVLVLKGGNALSLVHKIGGRASLDIDYSIEGEIEDIDRVKDLIFTSLRNHLESQNLIIFDEQFYIHPRITTDNSDTKWGGYTAEFKIVEKDTYDRLSGDIDKIRNESLAINGDPQGSRKFNIHISKHEYCEGKREYLLDDRSKCYSYTPAMIVAEKLRSLCQQMEEYEKRTNPTTRARDFFDIYSLLTEGSIELSEGGVQELINAIFSKKEVPLKLLDNLEKYRDFHRDDWPSVSISIPSKYVDNYDFYVDFVISEVRKLQVLWVINSP